MGNATKNIKDKQVVGEEMSTKKERKAKESYFDKLSVEDQEAEKRMMRNLLYLAERSSYNITQIGNILKVKLVKGDPTPLKNGMSVTVVQNAAKLFGVNFEDIAFKDLEKEATNNEDFYKKIEELQKEIHECKKVNKELKEKIKRIDTIENSVIDFKRDGEDLKIILERFKDFIGAK